MEEDYEEGILSHQSPGLVAVRPELRPVPSEGWYEGYSQGLYYAPEELYAFSSVDDAWDALNKSATKQTSGMKRPRELMSPPNFDSDFHVRLPSPIGGSSRKPSGNEERPDWLPSHSPSNSLPQIQQLRPRRKSKRFDLPLLFRVEKEAVEVMACPDSGSDDNIISENFTKVLGLRIEQLVDKTKHFSLANGKTIDAVGQVSAQFSFALGSSPNGSLQECVFYVFSSLAVSVIMGMEFLQQTETLTKHTDRMIEQLVPSMQALRVNSIGKPKQNLICRLGTYTGLASPDTGSDLDLVSPDFARSRAFNILPAQETLQFADCTIGYTSGVIHAAFSVGQLDDCQGFIPKGGALVLEFHVLDNLTTDILLGQETIEALDIFNEHADSMIPSIPSLGQSDVNIIRHIGAFEAVCSRTWSKLRNKDKDETPVTDRDLATATQRENARLDTTRSDTYSDLRSTTYRCEVFGCTAGPFMTQYLLNSHENVHSLSRPHFCPVSGCSRSEGGKGFRRKIEMIRHGLVHESPGYVCPFCPDREHKYPRPDNLQRHVRVHHMDKDFDDPLLREVLSSRPDGPNRGRRRPGVPVLVD